MNDTLYLIVGKSGSGKDTVINKVCELFNYTKVISYTTRPMRTPDENTHIFVTDKDFNMAKDIVAYTRFNNYRYWATQEQCENNDFYIIDPAGIDYFKSHYHGKKKIIIINITAPLHTRFFRMLGRGDGFISAINRLINDHKAFKNLEADYVVNNINSVIRVALYIVENIVKYS